MRQRYKWTLFPPHHGHTYFSLETPWSLLRIQRHVLCSLNSIIGPFPLFSCEEAFPSEVLSGNQTQQLIMSGLVMDGSQFAHSLYDIIRKRSAVPRSHCCFFFTLVLGNEEEGGGTLFSIRKHRYKACSWLLWNRISRITHMSNLGRSDVNWNFLSNLLKQGDSSPSGERTPSYVYVILRLQRFREATTVTF